MIAATLAFFVPGKPVAWERVIPVVRAGKFVRMVTPAKTRAYEERVALLARVAARASGWPSPPVAAPYVVELGVLGADAKVDLDNAAKGILDGITAAGNVWPDDRCVVRLVVERVDDGDEGVRVTVSRRAAA